MGATSTKFLKKCASPFATGTSLGNEHDFRESEFERTLPPARPLVYMRRGSMYFDEDGDLAHEFYVEVLPPNKRGKPTMRRVTESLRPQGNVAHPYPRLHVDFPAVICHVDF